MVLSAVYLGAYGVKGFSQFIGAQKTADKYGFFREDLDRFALRSHQRATAATGTGAFTTEIVPIPVGDGDHTSMTRAFDRTPRSRRSAR